MFRNFIICTLIALITSTPILAEGLYQPWADPAISAMQILPVPADHLRGILDAPGLSSQTRELLESSPDAMVFTADLEQWRHEGGGDLLRRIESAVDSQRISGSCAGEWAGAWAARRIVASAVLLPGSPDSRRNSALFLIGVEYDDVYLATVATMAVSMQVPDQATQVNASFISGQVTMELSEITDLETGNTPRRWERSFVALPDDLGNYDKLHWIDPLHGAAQGDPQHLNPRGVEFWYCQELSGKELCFCECVLSELVDQGHGEEFMQWALACLVGCMSFNPVACTVFCLGGSLIYMMTTLGCWLGC